MKIVPAVKRLNKIEDTLQKNNDVDILLCSEGYITGIKEITDQDSGEKIDKFTYCYERDRKYYKYEDFHPNFLIEYDAKKIKNEGYVSEKEVLKKLCRISSKHPNVIIIPGTILILEILDGKMVIRNKTYIICNGKIEKEHYKILKFAGMASCIDDEME